VGPARGRQGLGPLAARRPAETAEWREALQSLVATEGPARARALLDELARTAHGLHVGWQPERNTPYVNTIAAESQPVFPGDLALEEKLASLMRWNALAMVVRANKAHGELGGHIASYASAADLFEVGFNHFFRPARGSTGATWCSSSRTVRPASTRAPSWKAG
jgi:pyruvate dehydrogenase E1 component